MVTPDLAMFKDGKTIFIEVKEENDSLKELQKFRIDELINQGFEAFCIKKNKGIIYGTNSNQNPNPITQP